MRSQLAAWLEGPGCKGPGLNKLPQRRHYGGGEGWPGRFVLFLDVCVLLIPNPASGRTEFGRGHCNQKKKNF